MWPSFGRERGPTSPNKTPKRACGGALSNRSSWGSLGGVAASTRLISQRSLVQIQPPIRTSERWDTDDGGGAFRAADAAEGEDTWADTLKHRGGRYAER